MTSATTLLLPLRAGSPPGTLGPQHPSLVYVTARGQLQALDSHPHERHGRAAAAAPQWPHEEEEEAREDEEQRLHFDAQASDRGVGEGQRAGYAAQQPVWHMRDSPERDAARQQRHLHALHPHQPQHGHQQHPQHLTQRVP